MNQLLTSLSGYKTYAALTAGAVVVVLNHFMVLYGYWPIDFIGLDPNNYVNDCYKLLLGATGRSAIAGVLAQLQATHASAIAAANIAQMQATPAQAQQGIMPRK
jgi:hypothetical protein